MKNCLFLPLAALAGAGGLLASGTSPAAAGGTVRPAASLECHKAAASLTVRHRAPVHTRPSAAAHVAWFAAKGKRYRIGGYCDNFLGNRWFCVAGCDFSGTPKGLLDLRGVLQLLSLSGVSTMALPPADQARCRSSTLGLPVWSRVMLLNLAH